MHTIKSPSDLKLAVEQAGHESFFFTRNNMKFMNDTMRNYGVRNATVKGVSVYELYRKNPVNNGVQDSTYFDAETFKRVFAD